MSQALEEFLLQGLFLLFLINLEGEVLEEFHPHQEGEYPFQQQQPERNKKS